jgi:large subunit ribosomal protein L25
MSVSNVVTAYPREVIGKANRRLAGQNRIPAVVYGIGREAVSISAHHAAGSTIVEMQIEGENKPINAMIRELQMSPIKDTILHVDFLAIEMDKSVNAQVTLRLANDPAGVKAGGILTTNFHTINVEAKPADLPEYLEVDVAALEIGDSLHVSDIFAPTGVTILDDPEEVLCSVQAPRAEEVEEEVVEEAEVEVIGEKEEEEE